MPVTKRDLPDVHGRKLKDGGYVEPVRPVLYCRTCGASYSASPGDYWNVEGGKALTCGDCGEPLELAHRLRAYVPWAQRNEIMEAVRNAVQWPEGEGDDDGKRPDKRERSERDK